MFGVSGCQDGVVCYTRLKGPLKEEAALVFKLNLLTISRLIDIFLVRFLFITTCSLGLDKIN